MTHSKRPDTVSSADVSRTNATFAVKYKTLESLVSAYTDSISKGGLFIHTDVQLPVNSMVNIKLSMPNNGPELHCVGQVARTMTAQDRTGLAPGMAIVFRDMSDDYKRFIEDYIAELSDQQLRRRTQKQKKRLKIVIADDDSTVLKKMATALESENHIVEMAPDGLKALALCVKHSPDLIISDIQMPKMDGWSLLKTVRGRRALANTQFMFQTSLSSEQDRLYGYQMGVDDYLSKPFTKSQLMERVNKLIDRIELLAARGNTVKTLHGDIEQVSLPTVLALLELEQKTGIMEITGAAVCRLYLQKGRPLAIDCDDVDDMQDPMITAAMVLGWNRGQFEFLDQPVKKHDELDMSMQVFLMEAMRIKDEENLAFFDSSNR